jgi:hypothetical protein
MSSFNSLELLSQAASLVQMSEEHKNGKCLIFSSHLENIALPCQGFKDINRTISDVVHSLDAEKVKRRSCRTTLMI